MGSSKRNAHYDAYHTALLGQARIPLLPTPGLGSFEYPYQYKLRLSGAENPLDAKAVLDALSKGEDGISPQAHRIATRIASMATPDFMKEGPITQKTLLQNIDLSEDPLAAGQLQP